MAQARFDASRDPAASPQQSSQRPACTWCTAHPARSDMPWCDECYTRYKTAPLAQYMAEWRPQAKQALPRQPGLRIHGPKQMAEAMRPARETVREWAEQMGIDDGIEADRKWRAEHSSQPAVSAPAQNEPPWWVEQ